MSKLEVAYPMKKKYSNNEWLLSLPLMHDHGPFVDSKSRMTETRSTAAQLAGCYAGCNPPTRKGGKMAAFIEFHKWAMQAEYQRPRGITFT